MSAWTLWKTGVAWIAKMLATASASQKDRVSFFMVSCMEAPTSLAIRRVDREL